MAAYGSVALWVALLALAVLAESSQAAPPPRFPKPAPPTQAVRDAHLATHGVPLPSSANCTTHWFEQTLDHFGASPGTWRQRYFICLDESPTSSPAHRPVFFYCGNEADVELYVNATGLMWENAKEFGAVLVVSILRPFP